MKKMLLAPIFALSMLSLPEAGATSLIQPSGVLNLPWLSSLDASKASLGAEIVDDCRGGAKTAASAFADGESCAALETEIVFANKRATARLKFDQTHRLIGVAAQFKKDLTVMDDFREVCGAINEELSKSLGPQRPLPDGYFSPKFWAMEFYTEWKTASAVYASFCGLTSSERSKRVGFLIEIKVQERQFNDNAEIIFKNRRQAQREESP